MSGRKDVWMPLYVADYLRDTQHLSTVEHGAYLLLIMQAWANGGAIPRDDAQLARITRLTLPQWRKIKATVTAFWIDHGEAGEIYQHRRIMKEIDRTDAVVEKRRQAGAAGAAKRWQNDSKCHADAICLPIANAWQTDRQSQSQSHNPPSEGKRAREAALYEPVISAIWDDAPARARQRSSKADVRKAMAAAVKRGGEPEQIRSALKTYWASPDATKDGGEYAKAIHRMIEGDRWADWISSPAIGAGPNWTDRARAWTQLGRWNPSWGPGPGEPGCACPAHLLETQL